MSKDGNGVSIIAVDTGGTFTDVVFLHGGTLRVVKLPSTPEDPARAVLEGVARALSAPAGDTDGRGSVFTLVHGSTVATNALLERRGARVALVTNRGFEDVLELGRQNRPQLYALAGVRPPPLVPPDRRYGVAGRLGPGGDVEAALDGAELESLKARVRGVEAVAICLLHSYANPAQERAVAAALAELGVPLSVSSELLPEYREYERTATTVVNAYVTPLMDRYLGRLEAESGARRVRIMGSGGGALAVERARREAVQTVLSGPAGGVMGALDAARRAGHDHIITFDMGGTSTDVSLCPGRPLHTREFTIAGLPVAVQVLDIHTVGAGGGSLAEVDAGGALHVGPASAGALPGPVCYGLGGRTVTVTDAHVWLGRLPPDAFLGGERQLRREPIAAPLEALAGAMGSSLAEAAAGVLDVADTAMEGALRVISVERGHDPADFTLVAFGGAAGLHAAALASRLGTRRVLLPPNPGVLSAYGMLVAPVGKAVARTVLLRAREGAGEDVDTRFAELEAEALEAMVLEGIESPSIALRRRVDARYEGQSYELTVAADGWVDRFHAAHQARYGYAIPGGDVEAVTLRVEALGPAPDVPAPWLPDGSGKDPVPTGTQRAYVSGEWRQVSIFSRPDLLAGQRVPGPAIICEYTATAWVPPAWSAEVDGHANLLLARVGNGGRDPLP